ncbi:hypothetical protein [Streptomyces sp. NPDC017993]|uniref:hypothetical protein n=1 Tax=Streptomyces sp. NPDC017993 TaxID=3365027 RepID=UPI0037B48EBA
MSAVSVLPAAVRLPRSVAVRRALLAGLFLVGFVALGFAFGPGAHADDRTAKQDLSGAAAPVKGQAVDESAADLSTRAPAPDETSTPARAATRDGATDRLSRSEAEFAQQRETARTEMAAHKDAADGAFAGTVRPAAEQAARVTDPVAAPVTGVARELRDAAGTELPIQLPTCENAGQPGDGTPGKGGAPFGEQPAGARAAGATGSAAQAYADAAHDPRTAAEQARPAVQEQRDQGSHGLPGQTPQGPVPAPSSHTAGDGHGPRGGDQNAASTADSPRFRLLPGGVRTADGAPTRRRAEEILEFPG